jgi:hypothetical protein
MSEFAMEHYDDIGLKPGDSVVLTAMPQAFLADLPSEDQDALTAVVGTPVTFLGYDDAGRAELEFKDRHGVIHFIYVTPNLIRAL